MKKFALLLILEILFFPNLIIGQTTVQFNLADLYRNNKLISNDRNISIEKEKSREYIRLEEKLNGSAILLPARDFKYGKIEVFVRGKDILQGSFIGIVFHAINDSVFDVVYCRPFNFQTSDSIRRIHMIQYAYFPKLDWQILRTKHNGIYEKGIVNPPNADEWFKMTLEINGKTIKAYINNSTTPALVVDKLNTNMIGKVGIFGTNCDFESIKIGYSDK